MATVTATKKMRWLTGGLVQLLVVPTLIFPMLVSAQTTSKPTEPLHELTMPAGSNQIPLLDNRFRIDFAVEEITLVFFRKRGSPSIVLVRPDGSKVYARTAKEQNMQWFDDKTYDLIKITNPTPGPWQALGDILPESRIMVLTDIDLRVDPLPNDMMLGEHLKVTARLTNGGKPVNAKDFRDILQLDVLLISTQKPEYDNANSTVLEFTKFLDDGKNFDERPRDAVFTGEFNLNIQAGEWVPKYIVTTPLYTRELLQDPIIVARTPVDISFVEGLGEDERHQVTYTVTEGPMDANSLMVQGRLRYPNGEVQSFTLGEAQAQTRLLEVANAGTGTYRIEHMLYGKTKQGREFVIALPEYTFAAIGPKVEVPKDVPALTNANGQMADGVANAETANNGIDNGTDKGVMAGTADLQALPDTASLSEPEPVEFPWGLVIGVNLLILLVGGAVVVYTMFPSAAGQVGMLAAKLNPSAFLKKRKAATEATPSAETAAETSDLAAKKSPKNNGSDDILDLSLPDD